jgi:hypothetical protein
LEKTIFKVRSDHQALRWFFSVSSTDGIPRVVQWKLALSAYEFTVEYKPDAANKVPDELSRMNTNGYSFVDVTAKSDDFIPRLVVQATLEDLLPPPSTPIESPLISVPHELIAISLCELSEEQAQDLWCRTFIEQIEKEDQPPKPPGLLLDESRP